jgi:hypothetical protein
MMGVMLSTVENGDGRPERLGKLPHEMDPRTSSSFSDDVPFVVLMLVDSNFSSNVPFDILMRMKAVVFLALSFVLRSRAVYVCKQYAESYSDLVTLIHVKHLVVPSLEFRYWASLNCSQAFFAGVSSPEFLFGVSGLSELDNITTGTICILMAKNSD